MALEMEKRALEIETSVGIQYNQVLIRAEALVPGAGREAIEPLMSEGSVSVTTADVQTDRVVLEGEVYCQAVYRQGEESTLRALTAQTNLSHVAEIAGAAAGMTPRVLAQVEHVDAKYENGHMVFQVTCGIRTQVLQLEQAEVIDSVQGAEGIETEYREICSYKLAADGDADLSVKGEIALPAALDARTSLMDWGAAVIDSQEADLGGLRVKGRVMVETLIASGVTGRPAALIQYPIEFDHLAELPEWLSENAAASVFVRRIRSAVEQSQTDEDARLQVEAQLRIAVQSDVKDCARVLTDAYATQGNVLNSERETMHYCSDICRTSFSESIRGAVILGENAPGVGTVVAAKVLPEIGQWHSENGKGTVEGLLEASILYMPAGSELPATAQAELPFSIDLPMNLTEESWIHLDVISAEANALMSDRLELKAMVHVACETRTRSAVTAVRRLEQGEPLRKRSGIVILWPQASESEWEIAKRYALPVENIVGSGENRKKVESGKPLVFRI